MPHQPPLALKTIVKNIIRAVLLAPVAVVVWFEDWGWEPLARPLAALGRLPGVTRLEQRVRQLPPWAAVLAFGGPVLLLVPVKLYAMFLFSHGHAVLGLSIIVAAKIVGTALAARLFQLTEPALMRLPWFARVYGLWKIWKDRLLAQYRQSAVARALKNLSARIRAGTARLLKRLKGKQ